MNRQSTLVLCVMALLLIFCFGATGLPAQAQSQPSVPVQAEPPKPEAPAAAQEKDKDKENDNSAPFAPEPAPALPAGMSGSDTSDPRANLTPGFYDAGEAAVGIKHLLLVKKPDAFQLGTSDPDDPKVEKMV